MKVGTCRYCGHTPVGGNALECPRCAALRPLGTKWWPLLLVLGIAGAVAAGVAHAVLH